MSKRPTIGAEAASACLLQDSILVPVSLFSSELSPLEAIVKYLREEKQMRPSHIAQLLGRDRREVHITYANACKKAPGPFAPHDSRYLFPLALPKDRALSIFEHLVAHLQAEYGLRLRDIAHLTGRDERTIGTIARRAQQKAAGTA